MSDSGQLLRLAGLWLKTSARGMDYLVGRIGGAKILIMPNREAGLEGEPSHLLFLAPATDRTAKAGRNPATNTTPGN